METVKRRKPVRKEQRIYVLVTDEEKERFRGYASELDLTLSELVIRSVEYYGSVVRGDG